METAHRNHAEEEVHETTRREDVEYAINLGVAGDLGGANRATSLPENE